MILSVLLAYVIWTQVEIIRQYAAKWRLLGQGEETVILPVETPILPVAETLPLPVAPPTPSAEKSAKPAKPAKSAKAVKKAKPTKSAKSANKKG